MTAIQAPEADGLATDATADLVRAAEDEVWHLRLYVAGQSPKSVRAFANLKNLCEAHLTGHYQIEIIDLIECPWEAKTDDILAIPTVVRHIPPPSRKVVGDLSDTRRVLTTLQLRG